MKISKPSIDRKMSCYELKSEGYCLSKNAKNRTKKESSHTSIRQRHNGNDQKHQQHQRESDKRCGGDYQIYNEDDDDDDDDSHTDDNQSEYESADNDEDNDDVADLGRNINNEPSEEYDEDAQFYVSGTDLDTFSHKRKSNTNQCRKKPLGSLVECAVGDHAHNDEADGKSNKSANASIKKKTKRSPYESNKVRSRKSAHSLAAAVKPIPQTKKSAAAAAAAASKSLRHQPLQLTAKVPHTTTPPSPAMFRLKQRLQPPPPISDRSKRSTTTTATTASALAGLLKKHSRRNPMGLPPPAPSVSPSTSGPASHSNSDMHISLNSAPISHKGVSTKDRNVASNATIKAKKHSSEHCNRVTIEDDNNAAHDYDYDNDNYDDDDDDDEDTFRANKMTNKNVSRSSSKKQIQNYKDGNGIKADEMTINEANRGRDSSSPPLTLYTGSNPYKVSPKCQSSSPSTSSRKNEKTSDRIEEPHKVRSRVDFDESGLLLERDQHLSLCLRNPLYSNPKFVRPWKMFTRISEKLTEEVLDAVQSDFANGVEAFVDDFLHLETTI